MLLTLEQIKAIDPKTLWLEIAPADIDQATPNPQLYTNPMGINNALLSQLCLDKFQTWLRDREITNHVSLTASELPKIWDLVSGGAIEIDRTRIILIPTDLLDRDELRVPQEWVDLPNWLGDYYLGIQVDLESGLMNVWGFTSHRSLKQRGQYSSLDRSYSLDSELLVTDLDLLWLAAELELSERTTVAELPSIALENALELIQELSIPSPYSPRLTLDFEAWGAILNNPNLRSQLYQTRLSRMEIVGVASLHRQTLRVGEASPLAIRNENLILPSQISVGNGSDELLRSILIATCVGAAGSILVAEPTFSMYGILAQTLGISVVRIERAELNFEVDLAAAQTAISSASIRVVFMVNPNSPTGNALTAAELDWMRSLPPDILVVIDEAYFEFSQETVVAELAQHPNWIVLRTFSKAFRLAAHRVGYAVGHPQLIATLEQVRLPYNLPSISLAAAELVLQHRQSLLAVIPELISERDRLFIALAKFDRFKVWRSDANFLYVRLLTENSELAMAELVANLKIQGTSIRHTGGGLRISIGTPAENDRTIFRISQLLV
jgi:histidinol-phosphate aminotransferase